MVAPAPAIGSAGLPAAVMVMVMVVMAGLPGTMLVVDGVEGGAALPARPLAIGGVMLTGAVLARPATTVPAPAMAAPSGGVASVPA